MTKSKSTSASYTVLKWWVTLGLKIFYRRIEIKGLENLPKSGAVILYSNHQNAMMDPFLLCCFTPRQLHWLARADVFKGKIKGRILRHLNMIPIFRERDNADLQLESNKTFTECISLLGEKKVLALFPEGGHQDQKFIRPFKKGMSRILCSSLENQDVFIVPVGIDYSDYSSFRSSVLINFGDPLLFKSQHFNSNEIAQFVRTSNNTSHEALKLKCIHVSDKFIIERLNQLRIMISKFHSTDQKIFSSKEFETFKKLTDKIELQLHSHSTFQETLLPKLNEAVREYVQFEKSRKYHDNENIKGLLYSLLGGISRVLNFLPITLCSFLSKKLVSDHHFKSSILLISGIFIYPIYYILAALILFLISHNALFTCAGILVLLASAIVLIKKSDHLSNYFDRTPTDALAKQFPCCKDLVNFFNSVARND